ncbi:MAG: hypothetical protein GX575_33645 [Candidatus Anammoximicrobium sp.]|nr:hypothetical protein [Candidatus Anammoximicrobium sp.]
MTATRPLPTQPTTDGLDAYLSYIRSVNPAGLQVWTSRTELEFCEAVERAVEFGIRDIEEGARVYNKLDEPGLSLMLTKFLECGGIPAIAEGYHNGHVDVTVRHPADIFPKVLGECKKWDGFKYHCQGCDQLLNRYESGRAHRGFCLEFLFVPGMYQKLQDLRAEFDRQQPHEQQKPSAEHWIKGAFVTVHLHFTGTTVEILHLGCNVYHPDS